MTTATGTFEHTKWDEKPYYESPPEKGTIAHIDAVFQGDLKGEAKTVYALAYYGEGGKSAHYSGHLLFRGTLGGRTGAFVIFEQGYWGDDTAKSEWQIVAGSGVGGFENITGSGSYSAQHDKSVHYSLDYDFK
jgi:uncharacterized protein DUF3224